MKKSSLPESQKGCKKKVQLIATAILDIVPRGSQVIFLYQFDFDFITALFVQHNELNIDKKNEVYGFAFSHENEKRRMK